MVLISTRWLLHSFGGAATARTKFLGLWLFKSFFNNFMASQAGWMCLYTLLNARRLGLQLPAMWQIVAEGHTSAASWVLRWSSAVLKTTLS